MHFNQGRIEHEMISDKPYSFNYRTFQPPIDEVITRPHACTKMSKNFVSHTSCHLHAIAPIVALVSDHPDHPVED